VDRPKFALLRELGVNRLSLGVQSFQPQELAFLGRIHDVEDVFRAFDAARSAGFDNINLDFMFGLPRQSPDAWNDTLTQALALAPEHLSLYSLIVEPNTPLYHWVATGQVDAPDDDHAAGLYETAMTRLAAAGYVHYEVSNWAKPGRGCRHNLLYWRNQEYVGVGPGSHSHLRVQEPDGGWVSKRWSNRKAVPGYVKRILAGESAVDMQELLAPAAAMGETMMLGLRLVAEGVGFDRFAALHGADLREVFRAEIAKLQAWDLVALDADAIRLTRRGLMVGNQVFAEFLAG
jgi:oxygen-independent coproporphyrinogen-3 oxidase